MRICYYDLLDLERQATPLDIKKAYRRQALIWHPDKNGDRIQEATDRFALIQEAYEVLSDPQERSWYDGHRDSILRGEDHSQKDSSAGTTAEDLMRYFSVSEFKGYEDTNKGFYNVYRSLFQKLANEEEEASRQAPQTGDDDDEIHSYTEYPPFGNAETPFADNDGYRGYGAYVRDFYGAWSNFSTCKSFIWMDKWKLSDAPSRYVRRAMEKENKKAREAGKKEYNDTIRRLTEFVRKRDPRVKSYLVEEQKRKEAAAAEQKARMQREKQEWQAKLSNYKEQDWAKVDQDNALNGHDDDEEYGQQEDEEDEIINDEFYCVVCDKSYKSEKQFASHEASRRHLENVEILRQEMLADEENFEFAEGEVGDGDELMDQGEAIDQGIPIDIDQGIPIDVNEMDDEELARQLEELELLEEEETQKDKKKKKKNKKKMTPRWGFDDEDDISATASVANEDDDELSLLAAALEEEKKGGNRRKRRGGNTKLDNDVSSPSTPALETASPAEEQEIHTPEPEKESAKTKKEKRKEKKKSKEENANTQACNVCGESFETRNQLFGHITETGHALALPGEYKKGKKGGKRY